MGGGRGEGMVFTRWWWGWLWWRREGNSRRFAGWGLGLVSGEAAVLGVVGEGIGRVRNVVEGR